MPEVLDARGLRTADLRGLVVDAGHLRRNI